MSAAHLSRNRVLVVEDNTDIATLICDFLGAAGGFRTERVENAEAALEICQREAYDLLIVDHLMPGMDGIEFLGVLREAHGTIPAIMISGNPTIADSVENKTTAFLAKPFSLSRLLEQATKLLRTDN